MTYFFCNFLWTCISRKICYPIITASMSFCKQKKQNFNRIKNKYTRGSLGVTNMIGKMRENILKWFGCMSKEEIAKI